jgi:DUF971 family protein
MNPKKIYRAQPDQLMIEWDDGHRGAYRLQELRRHCPCAACSHESEGSRTGELLPVLTPGKNELRSIVPVGSYALQLEWGDGHRTGIYAFEFLRKICDCDECRRNRFLPTEKN